MPRSRRHKKPKHHAKKPAKLERKRIIGKAKQFIGKNWMALLSIFVSVITSFFIYFLTSSKPDIRFISDKYEVIDSQPIKDKTGDCVYYTTLKQGFKNLSFTSGNIDKVNFVPVSSNVAPEFTIFEIDRSRLGWGEEKLVWVRFALKLPPDTCQELATKGEHFKVGYNFYDDKGRLLERDTDGNPYSAKAIITFNP